LLVAQLLINNLLVSLYFFLCFVYDALNFIFSSKDCMLLISLDNLSSRNQSRFFALQQTLYGMFTKKLMHPPLVNYVLLVSISLIILHCGLHKTHFTVYRFTSSEINPLVAEVYWHSISSYSILPTSADGNS